MKKQETQCSEGESQIPKHDHLSHSVGAGAKCPDTSVLNYHLVWEADQTQHVKRLEQESRSEHRIASLPE